MTLQEACDKIGIQCREIPTDGDWHNVPVLDKPGSKADGRIKLFVDGAGGHVKNHISGETLLFWFDDTPAQLTEAEKARRKAVQEDYEQEQKEKRAKAAKMAASVWKAGDRNPGGNYLQRKQTPATDTIRDMPLDELVLRIGYHPQSKGEKLTGERIDILPVSDGQKIITIEMIDCEGRKAGLAGGQKKGGFWSTARLPAGDGNGVKLGIGEGAATVLSYRMAAPGSIGIAALSCGNLKEVAIYFRRRYPLAEIMILADLGNGEQKAVEAAEAIGCPVYRPSFPPGSKGTDCNDVHCELGLDELTRQLAAVAQAEPVNGAYPLPADEEPEPLPIVTPSPTNKNPSETKYEGRENPPEESEKEMLARLAKLSPLAYDRVREEAATVLGVRAATLDKEIAALRKDVKGSGDIFEEVEPWPEPIDPAALLHEIEKTIRRFIACNHEVSQAAALWIAFTWFIDVVHVAPLAIITAPEKRCGKSQLLNLMAKMSFRAIPASGISPAALFRAIELWSPTLFLDESDAFLKENEELRGLLNSGHTRDTAFTIRVVGDSHTVTRFKTWGAKALAGIGHVADTLLDRAIILELRRKLSHEQVDRIRHAEPELFDDLKAKLARFAEDYRDKVRHARPPLPESLNDRAQDNWEPLLAIALVAGGNWLQIGTAAALNISGSEEITQTTGTELLANIKDIFEEKQIDRISTTDLIKALCADEEWTWATYNRGLPIKPRQLANRLKAYGIHSKNIRIGYGTPKGFALDQFAEAFSRYTGTGGNLSATVQQNDNSNNNIDKFHVALPKTDAATTRHNATEYVSDEEIEQLLPYP